MQIKVERLFTVTVMIVIVTALINGLMNIIARMKITLTHLGSGTMQADGTEQTVFEFARVEPFILQGWLNLKNMENGDEVYIRQYHQLKIDSEYGLYAEEPYHGKQKEPLQHITPKPALTGVKITLQQTKGTFKYFPWEFYQGVV